MGLAKEYPKAFGRGDNDLGRTRIIVHHIKIMDQLKHISGSSVP